MYLFKKILLTFLFSFIFFVLFIYIFNPILNAKSLIFPYAINPFDIINTYPSFWNIIKKTYYINLFFSLFVIINSIFSYFLKKDRKKIIKKSNFNNISEKELCLFVGNNFLSGEKIFIPEKGLFQNILVTGTIGSRQN